MVEGGCPASYNSTEVGIGVWEKAEHREQRFGGQENWEWLWNDLGAVSMQTQAGGILRELIPVSRQGV